MPLLLWKINIISRCVMRTNFTPFISCWSNFWIISHFIIFNDIFCYFVKISVQTSGTIRNLHFFNLLLNLLHHRGFHLWWSRKIYNCIPYLSQNRQQALHQKLLDIFFCYELEEAFAYSFEISKYLRIIHNVLYKNYL